MDLLSKIVLLLAHLLFMVLCIYEVYHNTMDKISLFPTMIVVLMLTIIIATFINHTKEFIKHLKNTNE